MVKEEEEEDAVISNVKKDTTTNINTCSDSDNKRIGDDNSNLNQISQVWGTWDELVLSYAVKRHGFKDWDSIAEEIRSRSSFYASPENCRLKYQDLKRRFQDSSDRERNSEEDCEIPWLEELRSLRIAELQREVQRCDDSILSLQLKVKKLEEEKDGNDGDKKADLEDDENKPGNNETEPVKLNRETTESMNESNSTIADNERLRGDKIVRPCVNSNNPDPDPVHKVATKEEEGTISERSEMNHSSELNESGTSTSRGKRIGRRYKSGDDTNIRGRSGGDIKSACNKSQPLKKTIELIRSHPSGSLFESRVRSQATKDYKRLIKQHLDIKTIEKKLEKGSYVSSSLLFYRDLKLLFTNAIVFFPPSSSESIAAHELRTLVSDRVKNETAGKSGHSVIQAEAESSVSRENSSVPPTLVVCEKRNSSSSLKQKEEKKSQEVSARSSKRMRKGIDVISKDTKTRRAKNDIKKQTDSSNSSEDDDDDDDDKEEIPKEKKESDKKSKKKSAVDFLERIKKNSPEKVKETRTSKDQKKSDGNVKKEKARELRSNSNKSSLKPKQTKKETESMGKRSKECEKDNKQPKKRSRR